MLKTSAMMDAVTSLLTHITRALMVIPKPPVDAAITSFAPAAGADVAGPVAVSDAASTAAEAVTGEDKGKDKDKDAEAKESSGKPEAILLSSPPQIPAASLRLVVNVLDAGECSSRTFSSTLGIIQHLSHLVGARNTILDELKSRAEKISNEIAPDLVELSDTISRDEPVSSAILGKLTPASSNQAKLLRILKTIDFFGTPKKTATQTSGVPASKTLSPEEEQVKAIYSSLAVSDLWSRLGDTLGGIEAKPDLLYLSTVLLPLIESLLVVNKFTDASSTEFIDFTTAHSKILNTMVRNNPSLMSGSFAVLVRNSSMLDFENKRSFFFSVRRSLPLVLSALQQLHSDTLPVPETAPARPHPEDQGALPDRQPQHSPQPRLRGLVLRLPAQVGRGHQVRQAQRQVLRRGGRRRRRCHEVRLGPLSCCSLARARPRG